MAKKNQEINKSDIINGILVRIDAELKKGDADLKAIADLLNATANFKAEFEKDEMMTVQEVAEVLDIAERRAYYLVNAAGFPVVTIGRNKKINRAAFREWLKQHQDYSHLAEQIA